MLTHDPARLHAVLDLLGHPVAYSKGGFAEETDWSARVVLRAVVAFDAMAHQEFEMPGTQKPRAKSQRARVMETAAFEALAQALADHPRAPLGRTITEVRQNIETAIEAINQEAS